tara:strand:+ start:4542 stop:5756 length:1215 start_codon:yes stop_codon:yes gene_type:complete
MARANQGIRQDLNFSEIENEVVALSNLSEVGLAADLRIIQNNLRNTSHLAFNSVDLTTDEFRFDTDKTLTVTAGVGAVLQDSIFEKSSELTIEVSPAYNTYKGEVITVSGFTGTASTIFNGTYQTIRVGTGGTSIVYKKNNCLFTGIGNVDGSTQAVIISGTNFVYTNDDIVSPSIDVSVGSTTLSAGTEYFVCNSNAESRFKLSFTSSTNPSGISTINITAVPPQFDFIRKEPVIKSNITNFQRPEIQDEQEFGAYLASSINGTMDATQANGENADYFITKKYKGTEDTSVDTDVKFEGTVNLFDPVGFNANSGDLLDSKSPGIFIGNTRAFSADNNPWFTEAQHLSTNSFEVSIGELEFLGGAIDIEGINAISATSVEATTFTHKIPVTVNGETYYLLMKPA